MPIAPNHSALQQNAAKCPRPLPLFLEMLREETAGSPERQLLALAGLRRYQDAQRDPRAHAHRVIAAQHGDVKLWRIPPHRHPAKAATGQAPMVLIPSIINSHDILDLGKGHSLARYLAGRGHATYLVDWGTPEAEQKPLSISDLVADRLLPLIATLPESPILIGYCLGGTFAIAAAAMRPVRALVTLAAPWHFSRYPDDFRRDTVGMWQRGQEAIGQWGVMPMEVLQEGFWSIDRASTIAKFERFAGFPPDSRESRLFVLVEDWANGGAPLATPAAAELFDTLFGNDDSGRQVWGIGGKVIDPAAIDCPMLHVASTTDRIVPHASAPDFGKRRDIALGHVGMIIGSKAMRTLWQPLARWIAA